MIRENGADVWHVLARHTLTSDMAYIFIVDTEAKTLSEVILGICYVQGKKASMGKILEQMAIDKLFVRGSATFLSPSVSGLVAQPECHESSQRLATEPRS